jgi:fucose 4-O-acetylase-like acetyltransferase
MAVMRELCMGKRIAWIDIAKGLGILLVISGHLFRAGSYISTVIFSFHMPLFFFFAGMLEHDCDLSFPKYLRKGLKKLLLPWVIFLVIGLAVTFSVPAWRREFDANDIPIAFYTLSAGFAHVGQIWFLSCLLGVKILFYFFNKLVIKSKNIPFIFFSLAALTIAQKFLRGFANLYLPYKILPFQLGSAFIGLVFYVIGYFYKDYRDEPSKSVRFCTFLICFILVLYSPLNEFVNVASMDLKQDYFFYIFAFAGIFFTIFVSKFIADLSLRGIEPGKCLLQYIGKNSMDMFALHSFGLYIWEYLISAYRNETISMMGNMTKQDCVAGTVFVLAFTLVIAYFFKAVRRIACKQN